MPCWLLIPLTYIFYNLHLHQACPDGFSSFLLTSSTTFTFTKSALLASYTSYFHPSITFTFTKCKDGYSGDLCNVKAGNSTSTAVRSDGASHGGAASIAVAVCIAVVVVILTIVVVFLLVVRWRKRRQNQYGHKRMDKRRGNNLNVTNPVYLKRDINDDDDDDDDDELNPFDSAGDREGRVILNGEQDSNFSSLLFDAYSNNSTQHLLQDGEHSSGANGSATGDRGTEHEENHNMLERLEVGFSSPAKKKSKKSFHSVA
ncbi:hypothetical protein PoB_004731400 [Plakobranchus ocellatus]|uniref:EGF-like domain-containing protein n=1 Tax=Plakobranchus ocellatus TaxID=259542 RepID=A0AAV4BKY9_9GAST|nr:hypothetical protein PoB_004731400 [Plakobranchus ocellatus]